MRIVLITCLIASLALAEEPKQDATLTVFAKGDLGKLPTGWTAARTGEGEGSIWKVTADGTGYSLTQTAMGPNRLFNLCVQDGSSFRDGAIQIQVRAISGEIDQGGGLVWRYIDANNYYVCRFNPLEKNYRLYTVKDGKRKELASKEKIELPAGKPFTVSVKHVGSKIVCELNGDHRLETNDETFPKSGKVGLWTKADAITAFDHLKIESRR